MKINSRSFLPMLGSILIFQVLVVYFINLQRPFWGDEAHFVSTVRTFGNGINWELLRTYNEMSGPLPFLLYAFWGRLFGFDLPVLRVFSIIVALLTYLLYHHLLLVIFQKSLIALLTTILLVVQPYMIGFSVFVFTDMLAIFFLIMVCLATFEQKPFLMVIALSLGLLTRQYLIFLVLALGIYFLVRLRVNKDHTDLKMLLALGIALIPLLSLMIFWKGFSPDNELKSIYLANRFGFHPSHFTLYVSQLFVYLLPFVILVWRRIYLSNFKITISSLLLSLIYWLFPIAPSPSAIESGIDTVGFFHRGIRMLIDTRFEQFFLFLVFALGLQILINIILDAWKYWKAKQVDFIFFCILAILAFLIVMPFSYLGWEKYFLLVVPLAYIYLISIYLDSKQREIFHKSFISA